MRRTSSLALLLLLSGTPVSAQVEWLPPQYEEGAARALVERLEEIGVEMSLGEEERLEGARAMIRDLGVRIDGWGLEGTLDLAPELAGVDIPPIENRIVAAIAAYGVCALPLHPELVETNDEKLAVALGEISVVVVSAFLRQRFLDAGGTDQQLAEQLNTETMNQLSYDIQVSEEQRNYVAAECGPTFTALFGS